MASTVGVSGFVAPDGRVSHATGLNTREVVVGSAARRRTHPRHPPRLVAEVALAALAAAALVGAAVLRRRQRVRPG